MNSIPYFDAHCDTVSACLARRESLRKNGGHLDLARLSAFSRAAQIFAVFADADALPQGELLGECRRQRDFLAAELAANSDIAVFCRSGSDVRKANDGGKIAALLSVEGGELLGCDPANLSLAKGWGVQCVNLTWNHANALSGSHADAPDRGLTDTGRAFVREAERLGILLDVSHLSDAGFWDLAGIAAQPIAATHSDARAVCPHSRNLTDDMFRVICESGGVAGLNLYTPFVGGDGMDAVLRHLDHFLSLGGEKHICLGLDLDGCDRLSGGLRGVQDAPLLWDALSRHGYDDGLLEDIFCNNLLRVIAR